MQSGSDAAPDYLRIVIDEAIALAPGSTDILRAVEQELRAERSASLMPPEPSPIRRTRDREIIRAAFAEALSPRPPTDLERLSRSGGITFGGGSHQNGPAG